jgi:hypothetical protein
MSARLIKVPYLVTNIKPPIGTPINWSHPSAQGLIGLWMLDAGKGSPRDLVRGNHATAMSATWDPYGDGVICSTTGPKTVTYGQSLIDLITGQSALSFMIITKRTNNTVNQGIIGIGAVSYRQISLSQGSSWNVVWGISSPAVSITSAANSFLADGYFHNIIGTYRKTNDAELFIDGISAGTDTVYTGTINAGQTVAYLGYLSGGFPCYDGTISSFYLWNRGISKQEAYQLYLNPYGIFEKSAFLCSGGTYNGNIGTGYLPLYADNNRCNIEIETWGI